MTTGGAAGITMLAARQEGPYRLVPHESGLGPGFEVTSLNRLAGEFEEDEIIDRLHRASRSPSL
ncbi:hypothetical protein [Pseudofrankia inefficax]|uniref:Uncharacterized protein n=1 Tax=Pseudofrankia inefficax (strain DSM 45817 / CECT 9037 / DDB 130130 / EuI1c) TaxID=298654 RepID=E3IY30_PSEI1|nr:hypothetical protein [Pseudofrankia inefficax]ADP82628.1 hypothetical protein FraEuI1c_4635 [Pseudofrankia inefficax]